jgi:hypothetical protein
MYITLRPYWQIQVAPKHELMLHKRDKTQKAPHTDRSMIPNCSAQRGTLGGQPRAAWGTIVLLGN